MVSTRSSFISSLEYESIKIDLLFYIDIILNLLRQPSNGILIYGITPFISLFIIESYSYLKKYIPEYAEVLSLANEKIVRTSRMRVKLFDDSSKRVDRLIELLAYIIQFNKDWHIEGHKGCLRPLQRALQSDLGLFIYNNHIIGSTHTGMINLGYEKEDLPKKSDDIFPNFMKQTRKVSEEMGKYLGDMVNFPEFTLSNQFHSIFNYRIDDEKQGYQDVKSNKYLKLIFNGPNSEEINLCLLYFLIIVNNFQYIFSEIVVETPITLFKIKFIMLYHLYSSITKFRDYYYPNKVFTELSNNYIRIILEDEQILSITKKKDLRNILVHYKILNMNEERMNREKPLFGLIEYYFDGKSFNEINDLLDNQILKISNLLENWLNWHPSPFFYTKWDFSKRK
jgi:hypothetical protein